MKADGDILLVLGVQFAVMSLLALGGANAVVPEMHRQAVELDAKDAYARYSRGLTLRRLGREDAAAADIARAKEIEPGIGP